MSTTTNTDLRQPTDTDDVIGRARADMLEPGHSLLQRLVATDSRVAPAIARLSLGLVILPHALQKTLGWFGGPGFSGAYEAFRTTMHIPGPLAFLAIFAELAGSIGLILGVLTRVSAVAVIAVMLGAIGIVH
ncbi:MAG: DoxX family protein, partial [Myxococcales bacterium]|nr:DoxX family protein [Myxococcales bacterium]